MGGRGRELVTGGAGGTVGRRTAVAPGEGAVAPGEGEERSTVAGRWRGGPTVTGGL